MKEVIIFGGSFNPPTNAHVGVIEHCLAEPEIDEVWVMPSGDRFDKQYSTSDDQRMGMLELVKAVEFPDEDRLHISDFELQLPRPTTTCQTIGALGIAHPDTRFWFAFGADAYHSMPTWEKGLQLQRELPMYILPRDGCAPPQAPNIRLLPPVRHETSSTIAREAAAQGQPLEKIVPRAIARHIEAQRLYAAV